MRILIIIHPGYVKKKSYIGEKRLVDYVISIIHEFSTEMYSFPQELR